MLNQIIFVGILKEMIIKDDYYIIKLEVPRRIKENDTKRSDIITLKKYGINQLIEEQMEINGIVGVKGHIETDDNEIMTNVIDRLTFLSSKKRSNK